MKKLLKKLGFRKMDEMEQHIAFKAQNRERKTEYDRERHHQIALEIAEESVVLLKNEENKLPIQKRKTILETCIGFSYHSCSFLLKYNYL